MKKLYTFLIITLVGLVANAQVEFSYPTPICISSSVVAPILSINFTGGGTFTSSSGLVIDTVTGVIATLVSTPGTYMVTYTIPSDMNNPGMSASFIVTLIPSVVPAFNDIPAFCYGNNPPTMPSVSNNGVSGTWTVTVSNVLNSTTATYTFNPNYNECAMSITMSITVFEPVAPILYTSTDSNTVYVDENNTVVVPLTLSSGATGSNYTYQWFLNGALIAGATADSYTVNTASANGATRIFTLQVTNSSGCSVVSSGFDVYQSSGTPPPVAPRNQTLASGSTLATIVISGTGIQWYDAATNKNTTTTALPLNTLLVDGATYYATQMLNGVESLESIPVTVNLSLGIGESEFVSLNYSPNPVKNSLTIKALTIINSTSIYNMLGQIVKTSTHNQAEIVEDMSELSRGTYFVRVSSGNKTEVLKIVKE